MRNSMVSFVLALSGWVTAGLLAAACGGDDAGTTQKASPPDAVELTRQAADRMAAVKSFHFVLEHERGSTGIALGLSVRRAEGDTIVPDGLRATVEAIARDFANTRVEVTVIAVGDKAAITNPFDRTRWVAVPGTNPLKELFNPAAGAVAALRSAQNLKLAGEETIDGLATWKVTADGDAGALAAFAPVAEAGYPVKVTLWIGKQDHVLKRVRLEGQFGPKDATEVVRVITLSRFDEPVTIELPAG